MSDSSEPDRPSDSEIERDLKEKDASERGRIKGLEDSVAEIFGAILRDSDVVEAVYRVVRRARPDATQYAHLVLTSLSRSESKTAIALRDRFESIRTEGQSDVDEDLQ